VGIVLALVVAAGEALRGGLDVHAFAALERLGAWVGVDLDLAGPDRAPTTRVTTGAADGITEAAGTLSLETWPSGTAYLDGAYLGPTPLSEVKLSPGYHTLRVEREGFKGYSTAVTVVAGRAVELGDVVLQPEDGA